MVQQMNKPIIYFDMDGVLADFEAGFLKVAGVDLALLGPDVFADRATKDKVFAHPTFFLDLPVLPGAKSMVQYALGFDADIQALTATGYSNEDGVQKQKKAWIAKYFPEIEEVHTVPKSDMKGKYAWPDIILIDDRLEKSIVPFREKGGIGIHHTSPADTKKQLDKIFAAKPWLDR
jgi:5'(3')-deoxyribonucleotidase